MFATLKTCLILCPTNSIWMRLTAACASIFKTCEGLITVPVVRKSNLFLLSSVVDSRPLWFVPARALWLAVVVPTVWREISLESLLVRGKSWIGRVLSLRCRIVTTVWWLGSIGAEVPVWRRSRWWKACTSAVHVRSSVCFLMVRLRTRCQGWRSMSLVAVIGVTQRQSIYFRFDSFEWCWGSDVLARHWHCCLFGLPCSFDCRIECCWCLLQDVLSDWWFQTCLDGVAHVVIGENGFRAVDGGL